MNLFKKLFARLGAAAPAPLPPPVPAPNWLEVEGQFVDLNGLSPAQLAQLEADLQARRQQREAELAGYLRGLADERARLLATADARQWVLTLQLMFGEALGRRVAIQDVGPGMQLQHLVLSFGAPTQVLAEGGALALLYGAPPAISYFEIEGDTIVKAVIGWRPELPFS